MRVAIDVSGVVGPPSGVLRYAEELIRALAELDPSVEYLVYAAFWNGFPERMACVSLPRAPNVRVLLKRLPQRLLLKAEARLGLRLQERLFLRQGVDLVHGAANILPRLSRTPGVMTLHHVGGPPETPDAWTRFYFNELLRASIGQADAVIAISEQTRREALAAYGLEERRIRTIWEGGASAAFERPDEPALREALGLKSPYILFVSAINARKNLLRLAQAYASLRAEGKTELPLVLVGQKHASYAQLAEEISRLGLGPHVRFIEGVGAEALNAIYRGAALFVYPSLLEGFGLPLLEAMTCSVPVVAARASCLPEIAGDAALYFEGMDVRDLARQMERALGDGALRAELTAKGLKRAKEFSWRESARRTLELYREVLAARRA